MVLLLLELGVVAEQGLHGEKFGTLHHHHLLALSLRREAASCLGPGMGPARGGKAAPSLVTFDGSVQSGSLLAERGEQLVLELGWLLDRRTPSCR